MLVSFRLNFVYISFAFCVLTSIYIVMYILLITVTKARSESFRIKKAAKNGNKAETDSALSQLAQAVSQLNSNVRNSKNNTSGQQKVNDALDSLNDLLKQVTNDARRAANGGSADIQAQRQLQEQLQALNSELDKLMTARGGAPSVRALVAKNEINALLAGFSPASSKDDLFKAAEMLSKALANFFQDVTGEHEMLPLPLLWLLCCCRGV